MNKVKNFFENAFAVMFIIPFPLFGMILWIFGWFVMMTVIYNYLEKFKITDSVSFIIAMSLSGLAVILIAGLIGLVVEFFHTHEICIIKKQKN